MYVNVCALRYSISVLVTNAVSASDSSGTEALARKEHRALRPEARECAAVIGRRAAAGQAVRLRLRAHHRGEVLPSLRSRHTRLPRSVAPANYSS